MPRGEGAPPVVEGVMIGLGADVYADQSSGRGRRGRGRRDASCQEIWAGTADHVFYYVGQEGGEDHGDCEAEDGDVVLVGERPGGEVVNCHD